MQIALGIVNRNNKFLLVERFVPEGDLSWSFPSGKQEDFDFSLEDTVIRETREETGIECVVRNFLTSKEIPIGILNYFICDYKSGEIHFNDPAIRSCFWLTPEQIYNRVTSEVNPKVVEYFNSLK